MPYNELEITPQPVTGIRRKARRFQTITHEDGELTIELKVIFLASDGSEIIDTFRALIGEAEGHISHEQFRALESKYFPYNVTHTTRGSFVDPSTGNLVVQETQDAIPEIEWLRNLGVNTHLQPMLFAAGLIEEGEERHVIIEEAFEKMVMLRMDSMKRY